MITNLYTHRHYIWRNAIQELKLRYAGSTLGGAWNILLPLALVIINFVVFARMFSLRVPGRATGAYTFVLYLSIGIFPWHTFSSGLIRGSQAFISNANYIKLLPVPEEIFVGTILVTETVVLTVYLLIMLVIGPIVGQPWSWHLLLLPIVGLLFHFMAFGMGLFLATLNIFFRDISQVLTIVMHMWLWVTPIIWDPSMLAPSVVAVLQWNPAYFFIESFHELYLKAQLPPLSYWLIMTLWVILFNLLGQVTLRKLRPDLKDVL